MKIDNPAGHPCACGDPLAPFGIGPPLEAKMRWLCATCWQREPSTQKLFAQRTKELIEGDGDEAPELAT